MSRIPNWFERKFDFSFPVELYPNLCVRLGGTPARLEEIVRSCPHEFLVRRAQEKWSAQEHAGHLLDLEPLWTVRLDDYLARVVELKPADLTNRQTQEANHNARSIEELLGEFRTAPTRLVDRRKVWIPCCSHAQYRTRA
ncbi:MAG: hypothetical protein LAO30_23535 [Acidobacteriia bacterium]|nr:hypothetical protein [Terriglobia bacterium]